jgi:DNA-binding transcriptional ArsR family regulator
MSGGVPQRRAAADVFRAVADANRRTLLDAMVSGETRVGQLVEASGLSYSAVSQHLAILRKAGLVVRRRNGRYQLYRLEPRRLSEVHAWAGRYARFWQTRLGRLKRLVEATR